MMRSLCKREIRVRSRVARSGRSNKLPPTLTTVGPISKCGTALLSRLDGSGEPSHIGKSDPLSSDIALPPFADPAEPPKGPPHKRKQTQIAAVPTAPPRIRL